MSAAIIQVKEAPRRRMLLKHKVLNLIISLIVHNLHMRFLNFLLILNSHPFAEEFLDEVCDGSMSGLHV